MNHAAMSMARPGDIQVIDGKGDRTCGLMGAIMVNACSKMQLGGIVMDAALRDYLELAELGFPVFCVGTNPNGPTKYVPGRINWPVSCGEMTVHPGDLILGDADGVVVVEREKAASLLSLAAKKVAEERTRIAEIQAGKNLRRGWLDGALRAAGLIKEGETL
jgi:4-hydroxy-4-methyl-2-oxoglutarate aldolase